MYKAVLIIISVTITNLVECSLFGGFGRLIIDLDKSFPGHYTLLLAIGASSNALHFLLSYAVKATSHRLGFYWTQLLAVICASLGLTIMGFTGSNVYVLIPSFGILFGVASGFLFMNQLYLSAWLFPYESKYHVFFTGLGNTIFPFAALIGNLLLDAMLSNMTWRTSMLILAAVLFITGFISFIIMYKCIDESEHIKYKDGQIETNESIPLISVTDAVETSEQLTIENTDRTERCILFVLWLIWSVSWFCKFAPMTVSIVVIIQHANDLGIGVHLGSVLPAVMALTEALSRVITIIIGDRYLKGHILELYIFILPITAVMNAMAASWTTYWQLMVFSSVCGFLSGPLMVGSFAVCQEIVRSQYVNGLFSAGSFGTGVALILGLVSAGLIYTGTGSYKWTFYLNTLLLCIATVTCLILRLCRDRCFHRLR